MKRNILITGANRGLGLALTKFFLENDFHVISCVLKEPSERMIDVKDKFGDSLSIVAMDVGDDSSVIKAAEQVNAMTDKLDVLINNAGVHFNESFAALEEVDFNIALKTFNINTLGPLRVTKAFLPLVKKGTTKVIANISSEAGSITNCGRDREFDYCMSKAALNMESRLLQNYIKAEGIKLLSIHPGWMKTDMGGPDAAIEAEVSAEGIYKLIDTYKGDLGSPIYMDYNGKIIEW